MHLHKYLQLNFLQQLIPIVNYMFIILLIFFYLLGLMGYWFVHDELESLQKQAIIHAGKFVARFYGYIFDH
jgi:hypothetical protein